MITTPAPLRLDLLAAALPVQVSEEVGAQTVELGNLAGLSLVAVAVAMFARSRGWGVALPLVAAGVLLSQLPVGPNPPKAPEVIQVAVLAPLVFGEALGSSYIDIRKVRRPILLLAIGLVVATTLLVGGAVAALIVGVPIAMCFALGAILAPTDAVAVAAAARRANLPPRVVTILEGESLVNDGTGLTALRVAVVAAAAGTVTVTEAGMILAESVVIGIGIGIICGFILVWVLRKSSDLIGSGGLLIVAPFAMYILTEQLEGSAILAIVAAGLMVSHSTHSDPAYRGRLQVAAVWRQITFVLQAIAFMLIGMELPDAIEILTDGERKQLLILVPVVVAVLIATRMVFVRAMVTGRRITTKEGKTRRLFNPRTGLVVGWAGARGPVSVLAAFSLPLLADDGSDLPGRNIVIAVSLCVIVITLLLAPTLGPLAKRLGVTAKDNPQRTNMLRIAMARAALKALDDAEAEADDNGTPLSPRTVALLRAKEEDRLARTTTDDVVDDMGAAAESVRIALAMAQAEQSALIRLRNDEGVPDSTIRPLMTEIDARIGTLRRAIDSGPAN